MKVALAQSQLLKKPAGSTVQWIRRKFTGVSTFRDLYDAKYLEIDNPAKMAKVASLLGWMEDKIPLSQQTTLDVSFTDYLSQTGGYSLYEESFLRTVESTMRASLQTAQELRRQWDADGLGVGIPGAVLSEMLAHSERARLLCEDFVGQENLLRRSCGFLKQAPRVGKQQQSAIIHNLIFCYLNISTYFL